MTETDMSSDLPAKIERLLATDYDDDEFDRAFYDVMENFGEELGMALTVFGGVYQAQKFIISPQPGLDGKTPLELLGGPDRTGSEEGRKKVMDFLETLYEANPAFDEPVEEW
jgi:hypothetical protein